MIEQTADWVFDSGPTIESEPGVFGDTDYSVVGVLKNNTDNQWSYVEVNCQVIRADGVQIADAFDLANGVQAYGRWQFKAQILDDLPAIKSNLRVVCQATQW